MYTTMYMHVYTIMYMHIYMYVHACVNILGQLYRGRGYKLYVATCSLVYIIV